MAVAHKDEPLCMTAGRLTTVRSLRAVPAPARHPNSPRLLAPPQPHHTLNVKVHTRDQESPAQPPPVDAARDQSQGTGAVDSTHPLLNLSMAAVPATSAAPVRRRSVQCAFP